MIVLGVDPGLAHFGWAIYECSPGGGPREAPRVGTFTSMPSARRLRVLAADDAVRRCRELAAWLDAMLGACEPSVICAEAMSHPRGASAAAKLAMSWGVLAALAERRRLPIIQASPQCCKRAVTSSRTASKAEVQDAVRSRWPGLRWPARVADREHAADALAAIIACLDSDVVRAATPPCAPSRESSHRTRR